MRHRSGILCFALLTLLVVLIAALPAFAEPFTLNLTVNEGGTASYVDQHYGTPEYCYTSCTSYETQLSGVDVSLWPDAVNGIDSKGNYDGVFTSWSGCSYLNQNVCYVRASSTGTVNVTANFEKVYGTPTHVSVTVNGNGSGYIEDDSGLNIIQCGEGYTACSATINSGAESYVGLSGPGLAQTGSVLSWSGCPSVDQYGNCLIPAGQTANVTATFNLETFTVTPSASANGNMSPNTPQTVNYNGTTSFTVTPNSKYYVSSVTGCGGTLSGNTYYTTGPITSDCTVSATFALDPVVTPSAGSNGSISPNTAQSVTPNGTTSFTVTPNSGYGIESVTGCGGTVSGNTYTTGPITSNCTVSATFASLTTFDTVTSSAGANGSVSPTSAYVYPGDNFALTITPLSGYKLTKLTDNGTDVTSGGNITWNGSADDYTYTISGITSNHTLQATFGPGTPGQIAQGPALSILGSIFLAVAALGMILWIRRKKVNA